MFSGETEKKTSFQGLGIDTLCNIEIDRYIDLQQQNPRAVPQTSLPSQGFAMFVLGHNYDRSHWGSAPLLHVCQCVERLANRGSDERRLVVFVFVCALV